MSNQSELAQLAGVFAGSALSNRNMVINGDLSVWQRGGSFSNTSSPSYTADRWFAYRGTVTPQSNADDGGYSLRWTYSSANNTTSNFISQMIEDVNCKHTRGQYVTLSFEVKANSTWGATDFGFDVIETSTLNPNPNGINQSITNKVAVTADWQRVTKTFGPIATTTTNLCITFGRGSTTVVDGEWFEVRKVQLEVGDIATPFEHRNYGQELSLCQRYFRKIKKYDANDYPLIRYHQNVNAYLGNVKLFPPMRTAPSGSFVLVQSSNAIHKPSLRWDGVSSSSFGSSPFHIELSVTPSTNDGLDSIALYMYGYDIFADAEL